MALIKFGALITDFSGKIGGTIFSKNRGGSYAKNRVVPNNPATPSQSLVRGRFGSLSSQWRTLTQAQRDSFTAATGNFPKSNRIGDTIQLAGNALFVALNSALLAVGEAIITSAPAAAGVTEFLITSLTSALTDTASRLKVSADAIDPELQADMLVQVFATPPVSPGISNLNSKFKQIGIFSASQLSTPVELGNQWSAVFGEFVIGARIGVRLVPVNITTGEQGTGTESTVITSAG